MVFTPLAGRVAPCLMLLLAPLLTGLSAPLPAFDERVLTAHNRERLHMGVEPLHWDAGLARSAQAWAQQLAAHNAFEHAPENYSKPQGENLWAGTRGYYGPEAMVDAWVREKRYYKPGVFPNNSISGRLADVGHYTQLVWRDTRSVGCAKATGAYEDVLVCRYSDAGNYVGQRPL